MRPHHGRAAAYHLLLVVLAVFGCDPLRLDAADGFPQFTWERVPLYAHVGIGDGLKNEQYEFLADRFPIVTFTGGVTRSSVEATIAAAAKTIKERRPGTKVLFYWSADMPKHQWAHSIATYPADGYLSAKKNGKDSLQFDVRRADVREWWAGVAGKAVREYGCDGIFVDGLTAGVKNGPWSAMFGAKQAAEMDRSVFEMIQRTRETMGPDAIIVFNPLHGFDAKRERLGEEYLPVTDGAMVDDFDRGAKIVRQSPEYLANTIETMRKAAQSGKIVIFKGWPQFTWRTDPEFMKRPHEEQHRLASEQILFPLACFLVGAEKHCYFCYTWGWNPEHGTFDWYPEFDKKLGEPRGPATREGWTYRREFAHASVFVDLEAKKATIDWK